MGKEAKRYTENQKGYDFFISEGIAAAVSMGRRRAGLHLAAQRAWRLSGTATDL